MSIKETIDWFYPKMIENLKNAGDLKGANELELFWSKTKGMRSNLQEENDKILQDALKEKKR
jgi:hypothetical protein